MGNIACNVLYKKFLEPATFLKKSFLPSEILIKIMFLLDSLPGISLAVVSTSTKCEIILLNFLKIVPWILLKT